jgi:hypothetical protein
VDVIGGDCVVQYRQTVSTSCFVKPVDPTFSISGKFKQKLLFVATMRYVPYVTKQHVPVCSWHIFPPPELQLHNISFSYQKQSARGSYILQDQVITHLKQRVILVRPRLVIVLDKDFLSNKTLCNEHTLFNSFLWSIEGHNTNSNFFSP